MTTNFNDGPYSRRALRSIGLWGAPGSGKTTFLAALFIAVNRSNLDLRIYGVDDESTEFLVESTDTLAKEHRFPAATAQVKSLSWTMSMMTKMQVTERGRFGRQNFSTITVPAEFSIDLRDAPGRVFGRQPAVSGSTGGSRLDIDGDEPADTPNRLPVPALSDDDMMDYLAGCDGVLLLIDPVREQESGDAHQYFQGTLLRIAQRRLAAMPPGSRLPHHVAVCISKFDHPDVYQFARRSGYRTYAENDPFFPRVDDRDAERFFLDLCRRSEHSDAELVTNALAQYFHRDRIRYFATSAIGFYLGQASRFREGDPYNLMKQGGGTNKIRGQVHPINVLEPMLWLGHRVAARNRP